VSLDDVIFSLEKKSLVVIVYLCIVSSSIVFFCHFSLQCQRMGLLRTSAVPPISLWVCICVCFLFFCFFIFFGGDGCVLTK